MVDPNDVKIDASKLTVPIEEAQKHTIGYSSNNDDDYVHSISVTKVDEDYIYLDSKKQVARKQYELSTFKISKSDIRKIISESSDEKRCFKAEDIDRSKEVDNYCYTKLIKMILDCFTIEGIDLVKVDARGWGTLCLKYQDIESSAYLDDLNEAITGRNILRRKINDDGKSITIYLVRRME